VTTTEIGAACRRDRIDEYVTTLAKHGATPQGGIDRPVYSPPWVTAGDQVRAWMQRIGLQTRTDAAGNIFGLLQGTDDSAGTILTGSHIDTVPNGGAYDGALGIHAGLVALESLRATYGAPRVSLEVVAICEEESSRFLSGYWGSRAMLGKIRASDLSDLRDKDDLTIGEAMTAVGLAPQDILTATRNDVRTFIELHIEQGPVLEDESVDVGVVHAISGQNRSILTVVGHADHAGTAVMDRRRDAAAAAAAMTLEIERIARELGRPAVATVGRFDVRPGVSNVVPGSVEFTTDVRHPDQATLDRMIADIDATCDRIAAARGVTVTRQQGFTVPPQPMNPELIDVVTTTAEHLGIATMPMISGAGHDSQLWATAVPTVMIFVPSHNGRSHSPDEFTATENIVPGITVLTESLRRLAY
jgi:allantoate deiminase